MKHSQWLWWGLAILWSLLLVQAVFPPDDHPHRSWVGGGAIWLVGLGLLLGLGYRARRRSR